MIYSPTYPKVWTEAERAAAEEALSKAERRKLLQECETPPDFWKAAMAIYEFDLDVCACDHNAKCDNYFTADDDSLSESCAWIGASSQRAWCNPGFSKVGPWHEKAAREARKHPNGLVVIAGIPGASAEWYKFALIHADEIVHLADRVQYLCPWPLKQDSNPRESVLYVYRRKVFAHRAAKITLWDWKDTLHVCENPEFYGLKADS